MVSAVCEKVESKVKRKRIRYEIPTYKKVYSVYQYDRKKYMEIWQKLRNLAIKYNNSNIFFRVNPYKVLDICYIKDSIGKRIHTGDAKRIFRYKSLQSIYSLIAYEVFQGQLKLFFGEWRLLKDGLVIYFEEQGNQAEIQGTELLPVGERLKIHIELLRQLRQGVKLKKAVKIAKRKTKTILQ